MLGFKTRSRLQTLIAAGVLDDYLRPGGGRSRLLETDPPGMPSLLEKVRQHTRVHCSSPLWGDQERPVLPPVDPSDRWAQRCNGYLDLECWGPPPWSADQWVTLRVVMEMAGE